MSSGPDDHGDVGLAETVSPAPGEAPTQTSGDVAVDGLGGRPVSDRLVRAVSRAKIAGALFASEERVKLGRYHLLELVGSGGMGVVWGAWDPELDRRVAIKLVKATMQSARDRILLEGQALAKLSHPNVVPVFDVGVVDEQVYLVMEWVRGKNLRAYCKEPRSVREIVAVYRDAGLGLSAAHHAGLIHRDFKPDNAIRGDDGRVRVLDFGLAREGIKKDPAKHPDDTPVPSSDLTRGAGTPRYMPPEQAQGGELTPAVDQYAFCVSLREALVGRNADGKEADVPGWLDALVTRGTAHDAKARFPSMDDVLRALARDPRTLWRRRAIVTGALGLAGAAFAIGTLRGGTSDVEQCGGGKDEIAKTWNDQVRGAVLAHLGGLGAYGVEESKRLDEGLTTYSSTWADAHRAACQARARSELTPQLYERSLGCLARANAALGTVVGVLTTVPAERFPNAVVAARELPDVARCATESAASTVEPPDAAAADEVARIGKDVERARVLAFAADPSAADVAEQAVAAADRVGYLPLVAKANLTLGLARFQLSQPSVGPLMRASDAALRAGDDVVAVEAIARQILAVALTPASQLPPGASDAPLAIALAEPIAWRIGSSGALARTLLFNNMGAWNLSASKRAEARVWFQRALAERRLAVGETSPELARVAGNYAVAVDDPVLRAALLAESVSELTRVAGPNHPFTLETRLVAGSFTDNPQDAARELADTCDRYQRYHPNNANLGVCAFEVGWLAEERGDGDAARESMALVTQPDSPYKRVASAYTVMLAGNPAEAAETMERLVDELDDGRPLWAVASEIDAYLIAASSWLKLGRKANAIGALSDSVRRLEEVVLVFPYMQRRLARSRAMLARLVSASDRALAKRLATEAAAWYRAAGGYEAVLAEMDQLATGSR
jgi:eukaryotic-like serine/threonine-protein kinase